uniref:Uncharacterized protein n=1 Tax=Anguilla anguilla TaxID=7936 RepID=A0A0E9TGV2_ANGAN
MRSESDRLPCCFLVNSVQALGIIFSTQRVVSVWNSLPGHCQ